MNPPGVKALVRRILADDRFRQAFLRSPDPVLASQPLTPEERRALLAFRTRLAAAGSPGEVSIRIAMPWP